MTRIYITPPGRTHQAAKKLRKAGFEIVDTLAEADGIALRRGWLKSNEARADRQAAQELGLRMRIYLSGSVMK